MGEKEACCAERCLLYGERGRYAAQSAVLPPVVGTRLRRVLSFLPWLVPACAECASPPVVGTRLRRVCPFSRGCVPSAQSVSRSPVGVYRLRRVCPVLPWWVG